MAAKIWQNVRPWGGYFGPSGDQSGPIWGVGYSNKDGNGIMSAEWTAGAITMLHMLTTYYTANPAGTTPAQLAGLQADEQNMLTALTKMRTDNYASAGFSNAVPTELIAEHCLATGRGAMVIDQKHYEGLGQRHRDRGPASTGRSSPSQMELTPGPGVGRGFVPPEVEQRSLAVYEEVADVAAD